MTTLAAMPTTATPAAPAPPAGDEADAPWELTVDAFDRMVEEGIIPEESRVYLRDGRLFEKMAKTNAHGFVGATVMKAIVLRLPGDWLLLPEGTVALDRKNAPVPDFTAVRSADPLARAAIREYPAPEEIGLVVEVAVTSLRDDLTIRLEKYARSGIPRYWVIDVRGRQIYSFAEPRVVDGRGEYARIETLTPGQELPLVLDGREVARIPVAELIR